MAENRNITWNIKLKIAPGVTTRFPLSLKEQNLEHGKFATNPPSQLKVADDKTEQSFSFKSEGRACTASGTKGNVLYKATDNPTDPTSFNFVWDIPYSQANSGNVTMDTTTSYFELDNGGGVPSSGSSLTVDVVITQVGPKI